MRNINKGNEPRVLMNYKAQGGKSYKDGSLQIADIQEQLLKEQKGLCGYLYGQDFCYTGKSA